MKIIRNDLETKSISVDVMKLANGTVFTGTISSAYGPGLYYKAYHCVISLTNGENVWLERDTLFVADYVQVDAELIIRRIG